MEYLVTEKYLNDGRTIASARKYHGEDYIAQQETIECDIYRYVVGSYKAAMQAINATENA